MKNVSNLINNNGNKVANQFRVETEKGVYFQSYNSVICFIPNGEGNIIVGKDWNYSKTTLKYFKEFIRSEDCNQMRKLFFNNITKKEIEELIEKKHLRYIENLDLSTDITPPTINFKRVNNDGYGNPRYVCHFLNFANDYDVAIRIAKDYGGKKFHNKQYGGGIVFQTYNIDLLEDKILEYKEWLKDGNVHKTKEGYFTTQDSQWTNRIETEEELYHYYKKEFNN